jgi:hypothetical protein
MLRALTAAALILSCLSTASAVELADFEFQGLRLGASLTDFQRDYPHAIVNSGRTEPTINHKSFVVTSSQFADALLFDFADDKLFCIGLLYQPARIQKMGGLEKFAARLSQTFGVANKSDRDADSLTTVWLDQQANRTAALVIDNDGQAILLIFESAVQDTLNERRAATINLGF